jgi:hypothetical protein
MKKHLLAALLPLVLLCGTAEARDGFESVRCGSDIRGTLMGKQMSDEPVTAIEARHAALGLKDLGGDEISDHLNSASWLICGGEYMVLSDSHDIVRDVLAVPPHSRRSPEFAAGTCQAGGKPAPGPIVAVLDNAAAEMDAGAAHYSAQDTTPLRAKAAWTIDEKNGKFVSIAARGLYCPRGGIITADGGP